MAKMIDTQCNLEFPSDAAYLTHKKAGHKGGLDKAIPIESPPIPTPPHGVPPEATPSPEFIEMVKRIESEKTPVESHSTPSKHPPEMPAALPLMLKYIWIGEHEKCRRQPTTLELKVGGKFFSVAYCESCKMQLESREVTKL